MASKLHFHRVPTVIRANMGCNVISLMSVPAVVAEPAAVVPKPKHTMLPVLVVLFLASYGLMALLVVEQGRTIDSQRHLIVQLFSDSTELSHMKGKAVQDAYKAHALAQQHSQAEAHPQQQTPSTQVAPQASDTNRDAAAKFRKPLPQRPSPQDGQEMADARRSLKSI